MTWQSASPNASRHPFDGRQRSSSVPMWQPGWSSDSQVQRDGDLAYCFRRSPTALGLCRLCGGGCALSRRCGPAG